jgi:D-3-phosphoglycerate dehydrogenase
MNDLKKVIYLGPDFGYKAVVDKFGDLARFLHVDPSSKALQSVLVDTDAIIDASMKVKITDEMVKEAPHLKIISCATTGSDHIDRTEVKARNVQILTLRDDRDFLLNLTPAAEHSWSLLMACSRKLPVAFDHVKSGMWDREDFPGIMLKGKKIGIIGCGRIGSWMGRYAHAFGMEILGYDPYVKPLPENFTRSELKELVSNCDFITVHVHLTNETMGLVSRECFEVIKPGCIFINTSRGAVLDQVALLEFLKNGHLLAAGLDVLEGEPDIDHNPLVEYARNHDNLIITPHCGGFSPDAVAMVSVHAARKVIKSLGLNS